MPLQLRQRRIDRDHVDVRRIEILRQPVACVGVKGIVQRFEQAPVLGSPAAMLRGRRTSRAEAGRQALTHEARRHLLQRHHVPPPLAMVLDRVFHASAGKEAELLEGDGIGGVAAA